MPDFAKRLIKLRKERKLTQTELANFIGVGQSLIARWESGEGKPNFDYLIMLGEVLEVSFDLLLGGNSEYKLPPLKIKISAYKRYVNKLTN